MIQIKSGQFSDIRSIRSCFLAVHPCQIRYNICHSKGWSDSFIILDNQETIGYASTKGMYALRERDSLFEFFVLPEYQQKASAIFQQVLDFTKVKYLESQTNVPLMTQMVYEFGKYIYSDVILFQDECETKLRRPELEFRLRQPGEMVFGKPEKETGKYVLLYQNEIVADGGFQTYYNPPFADIYMEVAPAHFRKGYGTYILQEIKKVCYAAGKTPAARCDLDNLASRATLHKAGLRSCGYMLTASV